MAIKISGSTIIDDSRVVVNADKIGIGTPSPNRDLEILSTNATGIGISAASAQATDDNKAISVFNAGITSTFAVSYQGRVDAIEYHGTFKGDIDTDAAITNANKLKINTTGIASDFTIPFISTAATNSSYQDFFIDNDQSTSLRFNSSDGRLQINGSGRDLLTIRTTSNAADRAIAFQNSGNNYVGAFGFIDRSSNQADLAFFTGDANSTLDNIGETMRLTKESTVGIGTTRPDAKLHVFNDNAIVTGGSVGIGTTIPGTNLHISGVGGTNGIRIDTDATGLSFHNHSEFMGFMGNDSGKLFINAGGTEDTLSLRTNGVERLRITSTGNVGIGTTDPQEKLHVVTTSADATPLLLERKHNNNVITQFKNSTGSMYVGLAGNALGWGVGTGQDLGSQTNNKFMVSRSNGFVGVGVIEPDAPLHILNSIDTLGILSSTDSGANLDLYDDDTQSRIRTVDGVLRLEADKLDNVDNSEIRFFVDNSRKLGITSEGYLYFASDEDTYIHRPASNNLAFVTNDEERLRIKAGGNVGIGTDNPDQKLHVMKGGAGDVASNGNAVITLENSDHSVLQILSPADKSGRIMFGDPDDVNVGQIIYDHNANPEKLTFDVGGSTRVAINSEGSLLPGGSSQDIGASGNRWGTLFVDDINASGGSIIVNNYETNNLKVTGVATFQGDVSIGGTLTYEDVTNVDSIGLITARNGIHVTGGNVGIGTTDPESLLSLYSDATDTGLLHFDMGSPDPTLRRGWKFKQKDDGTATKLNLQADENGKSFIISDSSDNVTFQVNTSSTGSVAHNGAYVQINSLVSIAQTLAHVDDTDTKLEFPADNTIKFDTAGDERLRITAGGNVGIGTDDPNTNLHVMGQIKVDADDYGRVEYARSGTNLWSVGLRDTNDFFFFRESGSGNVIFQHGDVGIGTTNPLQKLNVHNSTPSETGGILVQNVSYADGVDKPYLIIGTKDWTGETTNWNTFGFQHRIKSTSPGGVPRVTIDSVNGELFCVDNSGHVGIGSTIPKHELEVAGDSLLKRNLSVTGISTFTNDVNLTRGTTTSTLTRTLSIGGARNQGNNFAAIELKNYDSDSAPAVDYVAAKITGTVPPSPNNGGELVFYTTPTGGDPDGITIQERLRITAGGNVGIGTDNPLGANAVANSKTLAVGIVTANEYFGTFKGTIDSGATGTITNANNVKITDDENPTGKHYIHFGDDATTDNYDGVKVDSTGLVYKDGLVGIGTDNPLKPLHIENSDSRIRLTEIGETIDVELQNSSGDAVLTTNGASNLKLQTNNAPRLVITSEGDVGINSESPIARLDVFKAYNGLGVGNAAARIYGIDSSVEETGIRFVEKGSNLHTSSTAYLMRGISNGTTQFVFGANGNVGIGSTIPSQKLDIDGNVVIKRTNGGGGLTLQTSIGNVNDFHLNFKKARGGTTLAVVQDGDDLGTINAQGYSGAAGDFKTATRIIFEVDGEPDTSGDTSDMPGRISFYTTADGSGSPSETLRITSAGDVGIGTTNPLGVNAVDTNNTATLAVGILTAREIFGPVTGDLTPTGNVSIPGNLTVTGNTTLGSGDEDLTTIKGNLKIQDADPVLTFIDSTNDSDFRIQVQSGQFRIQDNTNSDVNRLHINSSGNIGIGTSGFDGTGNVGIGTFPHSENRLKVVRDGLDKIIQQWGGHLGSTAGHRFMELYSPATDDKNDYFKFKTGNAFKFRIDHVDAIAMNSNGAVGVGTDDVQAQLHLQGSDPTLRIQRYDQSAYGDITADAAGKITFKSDPGGSASGDGFSFTVDNSEKLSISSTGITSIKGSDDQDNFMVDVSGTQFAVHTDASDGELSLRAQDGTPNNNVKFMTFFTEGGSGATERARITSGGSLLVGVTTTSNDEKFVVGGDAKIDGNLNVTGVLTYEDVTNIDSVGVITAQNGIHVTGGNVGIGTTTPDEPLHIYGSSSSPIFLERTTGNNVSIRYSGFSTDMYAGLAASGGGALGWGIGTGPNLASNSFNNFMVRSDTGFIGIDQVSPAFRLHVRDRLGIENVVGAATTILSLESRNGTQSLNLRFYDRRHYTSENYSGTEKRIEYNVNNNINKRAWIGFLNETDSNTDNIIRFGEGLDTEWMRIDNGNVGIGTTIPSDGLGSTAKLDVDGTIKTTSAFNVANPNDGVTKAYFTYTTGVKIPPQFSGGTGMGMIQTGNCDLIIRAGSYHTTRPYIHLGNTKNSIHMGDGSTPTDPTIPTLSEGVNIFAPVRMMNGDVGIGTTNPLGVNAVDANNTATLAVGVLTARQIFGPVTGDLIPTGNVSVPGNLTVTGNINANGNIVGDNQTAITGILRISGQGAATMAVQNVQYVGRSNDPYGGSFLHFNDQNIPPFGSGGNFTTLASISGLNLIYDTNDNDNNGFVVGVGSTNVSDSSNFTAHMVIDHTGKVGFGIDSPQSKLNVETTTEGEVVRLRASNNTRYLKISSFDAGYHGSAYDFDATSTGGALSFSVTSDEKLRITKDGDVGIGTTNPLDTNAVGALNTATLAVGVLTAREIFGSISGTINTNGNVDISGNLDVDGATTLDGLTVSEAAVFSSSVTVNSGSATDQGNLAVHGTGKNSLIIRTTNNGSDRGIAWRNSGSAYVAYINAENRGGDTIDLVFGVDRTNETSVDDVTERMRITRDGDVGIGTTNPQSALEVSGSAAVLTITDTRNDTFSVGDTLSSLAFDTNDSSGGVSTSIHPRAKINLVTENIFGSKTGLSFETKSDTVNAPSERMRITHEGHVGIGTTDPTHENALTNNFKVLAVGILTASQIFGPVTGPLTTNGNVDIGGNLDVDGTANLDDVDIDGDLDVDGTTTLDGLTVSEAASFTNTANSSSATTGAVVIDGGVGIAKSMHIDGTTTSGDINIRDGNPTLTFTDTSGTPNDPDYRIIGNAGKLTIQDIQDSFAGRFVVDQGGHIDIQKDLDIGRHLKVTGLSTFVGDAQFDGNVSIGGTLTYEDVTNIESVGIITAKNGIHVTGGSVGIGTVSPSKPLHIYSTDSTPVLLERKGSNNNVNIQYKNTSSSMFAGLAGSQALGWGIGINADLGNINNNYFMVRRQGTNAGNIGIGVLNPDTKLHVLGQIKVDASDYGRVEYARSGTNLWSVGLRDTDDFFFFRESGSGNVIFQHGDVGIGTDNPTGANALTNNTSTLAVGTLKANNISGGGVTVTTDVAVTQEGRSAPCTLPITVTGTSTKTIGISTLSNAFGAKYVGENDPTIGYGSSVCDGDIWYDTSGISGLSTTSDSTNITLSTNDVGKLKIATGTGDQFTVPANVFNAGDYVSLHNQTTGIINIVTAASNVTIYLSGSNVSVSNSNKIKLSPRALATLTCTVGKLQGTSSQFVISGGGVYI